MLWLLLLHVTLCHKHSSGLIITVVAVLDKVMYVPDLAVYSAGVDDIIVEESISLNLRGIS